ncbi:hypothetical protein RUM44_005261 [Polyplax serrata]|uniref:Uncharacterized protein n=1 Tax=Polyplax serrata TaxID=468196 RepID=A0ABR1AEI1_POLSC
MTNYMVLEKHEVVKSQSDIVGGPFSQGNQSLRVHLIGQIPEKYWACREVRLDLVPGGSKPPITLRNPGCASVRIGFLFSDTTLFNPVSSVSDMMIYETEVTGEPKITLISAVVKLKNE